MPLPTLKDCTINLYTDCITTRTILILADKHINVWNQPTHRVILTAYLIADDKDERGLYNYEHGKKKRIYAD